MESFYAGTSGLLTPIPKRDFPPEHADSSRLRYYSHLFNSIEINSSFYKLPQAKTLAKWATEVNDDFRFTFKLWREITHQKQLAFDSHNIDLFMKAINAVGTKKGTLLIQFPPGLHIEALPKLNGLLNYLNDANDGRWPVSVEFRHRSWYNDTVYELLEHHHAGLVHHDMPASATPFSDPITDVAYVRFHGPVGGYRGSYADEYLYEYAGYIKQWLNDGKTVYTYFNNTAGDALRNLQTLNKMVKMLHC